MGSIKDIPRHWHCVVCGEILEEKDRLCQSCFDGVVRKHLDREAGVTRWAGADKV